MDEGYWMRDGCRFETAEEVVDDAMCNYEYIDDYDFEQWVDAEYRASSAMQLVREMGYEQASLEMLDGYLDDARRNALMEMEPGKPACVMDLDYCWVDAGDDDDDTE